jgi:hypothetical protein
MPRKKTKEQPPAEEYLLPPTDEYLTKDMIAFREAAAKWLKEATVSPKVAHETMMRLGIQDKNGNLTKRYR